jgi:hypothetical protein
VRAGLLSGGSAAVSATRTNKQGSGPTSGRNLSVSSVANPPKRPVIGRSVARHGAALADPEAKNAFLEGAVTPRLTAGGNLTPRQREIFYHLMASYPAGVFVEGDRPAIDAFCQLAEMREASVARAEALGAYSHDVPHTDEGKIDFDMIKARDAAIRQVNHLSQMLFSAAQRVRATPNTRLAFSEGHAGMAEAKAAEDKAAQQIGLLDSIHADLAAFGLGGKG